MLAPIALLGPIALPGLGVVACGPGRGTIGAILGQRADGTLTVRATPKKLAAVDAGLRPGDELLLIDGRAVRGMSRADLRVALGGDEGTRVKLTVIRDDEVIRVTLTRTVAEKYRTANVAP